MRAVYAAFFAVCTLFTCSLRLARQPEARIFPRAVLTYVTLRIRAQFKYVLIAGAAEGATLFEFETATIYNCNKTFGGGGSVYTTANSSAVVETFVPAARVPWWKKCCLQRPAFVSNCMLLSVSLS